MANGNDNTMGTGSFQGQMYEFMGITKESLRGIRENINRILEMEEKNQIRIEAKLENMKIACDNDIKGNTALIGGVVSRVESMERKADITRAKLIGYGAGAGIGGAGTAAGVWELIKMMAQ